MITEMTGKLVAVDLESVRLQIGPLVLEIQVAEYTRRALQHRGGDDVTLHTMFYIEGGAHASRMIPRLIGFPSPIDREFFEVFCSVDGVGVRKALRALGMPVREMARLIQDQDTKALSTMPGIGEATADRIVAKIRRKVGKFALAIPKTAGTPGEPAEANGSPPNASPEVVRDTYEALLSVGHSESQAREAIDRVLATKKKFKTVPDMIDAIYQYQQDA